MPDPAATEATVSSLGQFPREASQTKLMTASGLKPVPIQSSKEGSMPRNPKWGCTATIHKSSKAQAE